MLSLLCFPVVARAALTWSAPVGVLLDGEALSGVACPSASQCTVVGNDGEEATFNPASPGTPSPVQVDGSDFMQAVTCPALDECVAVDNAGFAVMFNPQSPTSPAPKYTPAGETMFAVACLSASQCVGAGADGEAVTFDPQTAAIDEAATVVDTANGASSNADPNLISGLVCLAQTSCVAVDYGGQEVTFNPQSPTSPAPKSIIIDAAVTGSIELYAIACPSSTQCTAVDDDGHQVTFDPPAVGAATITPTPSVVTIDNDFQSLYGLACPSVGDCIAVDRGETSSHGVEGNPESSTTWTVEGIPTTTYLTGVACTSSSQCVATDEGGNIFVATPSTVGGSPSPTPPTTPPTTAPPPVVTSPKGKPTTSGGSLSGVAGGKVKLGFTVDAGHGSPLIKTIAVSLPKGLSFVGSAKKLTDAITLKGTGGKKLKFTAKRHAGTLTITLATSTSRAQVTIGSAGIAVTRALAERVKEKKVKSLTALLTATDTSHVSTRLTLTLKV
jgi:hypothetical protein